MAMRNSAARRRCTGPFPTQSRPAIPPASTRHWPNSMTGSGVSRRDWPRPPELLGGHKAGLRRSISTTSRQRPWCRPSRSPLTAYRQSAMSMQEQHARTARGLMAYLSGDVSRRRPTSPAASPALRPIPGNGRWTGSAAGRIAVARGGGGNGGHQESSDPCGGLKDRPGGGAAEAQGTQGAGDDGDGIGRGEGL
jgi:hypothetical protein